MYALIGGIMTFSLIQASFSSVKLLSWNVNGFRSFLKHDINGSMLKNLLESRKVDILCVQETKLSDSHTDDVEKSLKEALGHNIRCYWYCSVARKGYSGTGLVILDDHIEITDVKVGIYLEQANLEGRVITLNTPKFSLVNCYVPNSGSVLERLPFRVNEFDISLKEHIKKLKANRPNIPVIIVGDMNVAYSDLDYYNYDNPVTKKQAGTTPEEQMSFFINILDQGFIDTFRKVFPTSSTYSYFSARKGDLGRERRQGLRLDYILTDTEYDVSSLPSLPFIEEQVTK